MTQNPKPDFHVVSLQYALQPDEGFSYDNPPPVDFETEQARFHLADGILTCKMKTHFSDAEGAQKAVKPILRAWETYVDLQRNRGQLRFRYERPEIIDRSPKPPGSMSVFLTGNAMATATASASLHLTSNRYPDPPPDYFRLNPDAETVLQRYQGYGDGREPLLSMAYFCLTVLESKAGGRDAAAALYGIDKNVLGKMGELSSTRGDLLHARKADSVQPLSGHESGWVEAAVKMLIHRLGDTRDRTRLPRITMDDLPKL